MYGIILLSMKMMGKRQLGQMQISEFITAMILSELAALPLSDRNIPLVYCLVPLSVIICVEVILSFISLKSSSAQQFLESYPTFIIDKGVINQKALSDNRITLEEMLVELRIAGLTSVSEAEYMLLEPNGKFSVIPKAQYRQATNEDLSLSPSESDPDISLIVDGKVDKNGLSYLQKTEDWLKKKTSPHRFDEIFLFSANASGKTTIVLKDKR
jgi:uncharacterized membrane protein YcaP (DUF421 family)